MHAGMVADCMCLQVKSPALYTAKVTVNLQSHTIGLRGDNQNGCGDGFRSYKLAVINALLCYNH